MNSVDSMKQDNRKQETIDVGSRGGPRDLDPRGT